MAGGLFIPHTYKLESATLFQTEGEFDAMLLARIFPEYGFIATRSATIQPKLELVSGKAVYYVADNDEEGRNSAKRASSWHKPTTIFMPEGYKDVTDYWKVKGDNGVKDYIMEAMQSNICS